MRQLVLVICCITVALGETSKTTQGNDLPKLPNSDAVSPTEVLEKIELHRSDKLIEVKHFYLWTRSTPANNSEIINPTVPRSIRNSTFEPKTTYVIIHGFLGWGTESWILSLKEKLLKLLDCNVISVDWPAGNTVLDYYLVVGRVSYVAQDLTFLMEKLEAIKGLNTKDVHAIGHSLGAHIAGLSAKPIPARYGRITGLDPAGLKYHNVPRTERLDRGDAYFVDVMHTNGCYNFWNPWLTCYGINENLGHVDFWPNGGEYQPECHSDDEGELGCDHMMSYKYFLESLDYGIDDTFFLARNCANWDTYTAGNCPCSNDGAQYMAFYANAEMPGVFYLKTNSSSPFAERDAVCAPGKRVDNNSGVILIASSTGSGLLLLLLIIVAIIFVKRRKSRAVSSGLLIEEDDNIIGQENSVYPPGFGGLNVDLEDSLMVTDDDAGVTVVNEDENILVF